MKMCLTEGEDTVIFETSVSTYQSTMCNTPEDLNALRN